MKRFLCLILLLSLFSIVQADLILHYDFAYKNTPYTTWDYEDMSGNGRHGTEAGTWYHVDGRTDQYADLWEADGAGRSGVYADRAAYEVQYDIDHGGNRYNQRVTIENKPVIAANAGITYALWVNPEAVHAIDDDNPDPKFAHLIVLGNYYDNPIASIELAQPDPQNPHDKRVHGWIEGNGADTQYEIYGQTSVDYDTWTHIAIVFDRANDVAKTYVNGVLDTTVAIPGVGDGVLDFSGMYGQLGGGIQNVHTVVFLGMMDDVRIYDEALSDAEIAALVPEPASLIILGLGSLFAIRRRK